MEISNKLDTEFKVMIIKVLIRLEKSGESSTKRKYKKEPTRDEELNN